MGSAALDQHRPAPAGGLVKATVLVADRDQFVRAGIRVLLEQHGFEVCAEAADADEATAAALRHSPDACLLDSELVGSVIAATREITARLPGTAVVILAGSVDREGVLDALRAGAQGYLLKSLDGSALPQALRSAVGGEAVVSRRLVPMLLGEIGANGALHATLIGGRLVELTGRERDVARLLQRGLSTAQMAAVLGIAAVTVRRHVSALLSKLGVADRADAVALLSTRTP